MLIEFLTTDESCFDFDESRREIIDYNGDETNIVIPAEIDGMEVVSIGPDAFWNKGLKSIVLPPTLSVIGFYAFAFNNLSDIRIPESVALIEDGAFMFNKIKRLRLGENLFSIPHAAFRHNQLSKLVLPENTQEILSDAFGDNLLTDIVFEGAPTFIHRQAFNLTTEDMRDVMVSGPHTSDLQLLLDHHARHIDDYRALLLRRQ